MQCTSREATLYNSLHSVTDAVALLAKAGGDAIVSRALEEIVRLDLCDEIGLRLLHKHNDVGDGEAMIEKEKLDDEGYALVTEATTLSTDEWAPNSWILTREGALPLEYSDPTLLCNSKLIPLGGTALFSGLHRVLSNLNVEHLLGPFVIYSAKVYQEKPAYEVAFLEKTDFEHRANVVRMVDRNDPLIANSAKTKWYAKRVVDLDGHRRWITACNCFCSVFPQGGHIGTTTHRTVAPEPEEERLTT